MGEQFPAEYLAAKKYVDDEALNVHVLQSLQRSLQSQERLAPLQVLEIGGGVGTMLVRLVERGVLTGKVIYRLTDSDPDHRQRAKHYLRGWATGGDTHLSWESEEKGRLLTDDVDLTVILDEVDIAELPMRDELRGKSDLLLAHGVLDLFELPKVMAGLLGCLHEGGLGYFTCNFDGETIFLPPLEMDGELLDLYHRSMENRTPGGSLCGRNLLDSLRDFRVEIVAAGSSDWLIHPLGGGYPQGRREFLFHILEMLAKELAAADEINQGYTDWLRQRQQQLEDAHLIFVAKHLDILVRSTV